MGPGWRKPCCYGQWDLLAISREFEMVGGGRRWSGIKGEELPRAIM